MTPGFDGEQFINHLLDRIERNGRNADKAWRKSFEVRAELARCRQVLDIAQEANRRHYRDMKTVEAKIAEWEAYAEKLRDIIWASAVPAGKRPDFPDVPNPLEFPIPF